MSNGSDFIIKRLNNKRIHRKKYPIKLCAKLTAKLPTSAYKSNITRFKLDEGPLQSQIYFLTFVESPEIILYQYKETCEVILDYPKTGGDNIKYSVKNAITNILYANIDVHIRILISEFPGDGLKFITKLQSHCANMTFADKSRYERIFQQVTHKGGNSAMNYIKIFQNAQALSISVGKIYSEDQLLHIFLENCHQGGKYFSQIASHQAELRREGKFSDKNLYLFHPYKLTI